MNKNAMTTSVTALLGATLVAMSAIAQGVDVQVPGATVRVGPDKGAGSSPNSAPNSAPNSGTRSELQVEAPGATIRVGPDQPATTNQSREITIPPVHKQYRIGLLGGDVSDVLRAHLGLEGVGVLVREVTPGGTAAKAGVKEHDILLSADGAPLASVEDLVNIVREAGPQQRPIALRLLRRGKEMTIRVKPEAFTPGPAAVPLGANRLGPAFGPGPAFGGDPFGAPLEFRQFGPGFAINNGQQTVMINGVTATVLTQNGQRTITAKKGDKTWQLDPQDEKALAQLPPDVRQVVDQALGMGRGVQINIGGDAFGPMLEGLLNRRGGAGGARGDGRLRERMLGLFGELMNDQLDRPQPPAADAQLPAGNAGGEAPVFDPGDALDPVADAVELEIPAEVANPPEE